MNKKICVISSSRADYGLLKPFLSILKNYDEVDLQLIVTGSHLVNNHGYTYREIENDGFIISEKVEILLASDTPISISKSMGLTLISFAEVYNRLNPDILFVMGDRYEIFAAVSAAHVSRLPVAHFSGGEITLGAMDDAFRHSITKMSHLHFTSTSIYRDRVIQLGENPKSVYNVGEVGLERIKNTDLLNKDELRKDLGFNFNKKNLLVTYHPVTLENNTSESQINNLLSFLSKQKDTNIIFTKSNADTFGSIINEIIDQYVKRNNKNCLAVPSLGSLKYLSLLQHVDAVVGNSSSGIVEAPSFKIGTINIGDRQKGRVKAKSVIDCSPSKDGIAEAFKKLYSSAFRKNLKNLKNPYENQNGLNIILDTTLNYLENQRDLKKKFFDLNKN